MKIGLAYVALVLLWATTPLAIQWSSVGVGFLFGAAARMSIGLLCVLLLLLCMRQPLVWQRKAVATYCAVATQLYASMVLVYWAAQFVPSGWVSVVFGLAPLMTALIAAVFLGERSLSLVKCISYGFGVLGLLLLFGSALQLGQTAVWAIVCLLFAVLLQTGSAVWVKGVQAQLPALVQVAGGLCFAVPLYWTTWYFTGEHWPTRVPLRSLLAIVYLGVLATSVGFALYYYILKHLTTTRVALISLVSPVLALLLGHYANQEPLTLNVIAGVAAILVALLLHEAADYRQRRRLVAVKHGG